MKRRQAGKALSTASRRLVLPMILALLMGGSALAAPATNTAQRPLTAADPKAKAMQIRLTLNGRMTTATLADTPSARDFLALLPLTMTLEDYNATEKVAYLPRKLTTQGAPAAITPRVGDLAYYAPWGNIALFYRDFARSLGLIRLGRFDAGVEAYAVPGSLTVTIEALPH